jgi:ribosomal protein S18 acetylase RimI-like enzyme
MSYTIRSMRVGDYTSVENLLAEVKLVDRASGKFNLPGFNRMIAKSGDCCYVAETDERRIIGNVFGMTDGGFVGYIRKLAVAPDFQRQGIGKELVRRVVDRFREAYDAHLIFAIVERQNEASLNLLKSLGFDVRTTHCLLDIGEPR